LREDNLAVSELFSIGRELRSYRRLDRKITIDERIDGARLYDLTADPGEQAPIRNPESDLAKLLLGDVRRASRSLDRYRAIVPPSSPSPVLPDSVRKQLEGLGYLEEGDEESEGEDTP